VALGLLGVIWEHRLGIVLLLILIVVGIIATRIAALVSITDSMENALKDIRIVLEASAAEGRSEKVRRERRRRAHDDDSATAWPTGLLDWMMENPDESYRWLHRVPSDACALRYPRAIWRAGKITVCNLANAATCGTTDMQMRRKWPLARFASSPGTRRCGSAMCLVTLRRELRPESRKMIKPDHVSSRSLLAYFDTNVFHNLLTKTNGVTEVDEPRLRAAIASRQFTIVASHINLRESIAALRSRPDRAREQLRLIVSLADWDRFIRFSTEVLEADIKHFAYNGERANPPFERERQANHIRSVTQRIIDGDIGFKELEAAIVENEQFKHRFEEGIEKSRAETVTALKQFLEEGGEIPSFDQFLKEGSEAHARAFIKSFDGAKECERRGLDRLLKIPSIRIMVRHGMSLIYRIAVEEKRKVATGSSSADLQHALCAAAAADVFVTHDKELACLLHRVPIKGFRVLRLHELLDEIDQIPAG
jgi:hypothetical protein